MSIQPRLIQTDGYAVLSGVQMIIKAALEAGADALVGTPLDGPDAYADLLDEHGAMMQDKGVQTLMQPDAPQAITALQSAWLSGRTAVGLFDAMGVIDAAGVLLSIDPADQSDPGGVLLCFGNSNSSSGQAAVALLRRAGWAVIEPALQEEVKSFASDGLRVSRASGRPIAMALPDDLLNGAATVACKPNAYPNATGETKPAERASENVEPLSTLRAEARNAKINTVVNPPGRDEALPLALVTVGRAFGWARQAMAELGLVGRVPILRMGMLVPVDTALILRHAAGCRRLLVLDPSGVGVGEAVCALIREQAKTAGDKRSGEDSEAPKIAEAQAVPLDPSAGPSGVIETLAPWLVDNEALPAQVVADGLARFGYAPVTEGDVDDAAVASKASTGIDYPVEANPDAATRHQDDSVDAEDVGPALRPRMVSPPPGSSLVDLSVVLGRLRRDLSDAQRMLEQHRSGPIDLAVFGELDDAARLLLSRWAPMQEGMECDGRLAGAAAAGTASSEARRSVVLMTSRRFFALGTSAIADAVRAGRNTVFIIHTEDPAEAVGPRRRFKRRAKANALDMQAIVEGINLGRRNPTPSVSTIDPADRTRMGRLLERLVLSEGVHVVIARRRRGPRYYRKASEVHQKQSARRGYVAKQGCLVHCPEAGPLTARRRIELGVLGAEPTGPAPDPWTVSVSWSWHDDTIMHAIGEPSVGLAILERSQPERSRVVAQDLDDLPELSKPMHANADAWRATLTGLTGSAFDLTLALLLEAGASMGYLVRSSASPEAPDHPTARRVNILFTRHEPENAPHVPAAPGRSSSPMLTTTPMPGHADVLLATELTEAARLGVDNQENWHAAYALIDSLCIPDIDALSTGKMPDRDALQDLVLPPSADHRLDAAVLPIARLSEWLWGHQRYAAWVYLGYLVQRGLVPLTTTAIDAAGQRVLGMTDPRSAEAVRVGRKIAVDPDYARRALEQDTPSLEALLRTTADDLAEQAGSRRASSLSGGFIALLEPAIEATGPLGDPAQRRVISIAQNCVLWAGPKRGLKYAKRFIDVLLHLLSIDDPGRDYALTRAAIEGLPRAMLVPDEVYLAAILTSPVRYRRDRRRFNISLERGDAITYVHLFRPEFDLFKRRVAFSITLGERAVKTLARLQILRRIRPGWYRAQRNLRDQYLQALSSLAKPESDSAYAHAEEIIASNAGILGRGEVRQSLINLARRRLEKLLNRAGDNA